MLDGDEPNLARFTFADPRAASSVALNGSRRRRAGGGLRSGSPCADRALDGLVAELSAAAGIAFDRRWAGYADRSSAPRPTHLVHPDVGALRLTTRCCTRRQRRTASRGLDGRRRRDVGSTRPAQRALPGRPPRRRRGGQLTQLWLAIRCRRTQGGRRWPGSSACLRTRPSRSATMAIVANTANEVITRHTHLSSDRPSVEPISSLATPIAGNNRKTLPRGGHKPTPPTPREGSDYTTRDHRHGVDEDDEERPAQREVTVVTSRHGDRPHQDASHDADNEAAC